MKNEGRCYKVLREEQMDGTEGGVVEEIGRLSKKYRLPNAVKHFVMAKDIAKAMMTVSQKKKQWVEARAITCFNTGNLVFKDSNPHQMRTRDKGDVWGLHVKEETAI